MKKIIPFQKLRISQYKFFLAFFVIAISLLGIIVIGSAKQDVQQTQIIGMILGVVVMLVLSVTDYKWILNFYWVAYFAAIALLLAVFLFGDESNNARRWLDLGYVRFQPSELCKILLIIFFAAYFTKHKDDLNKPYTIVKVLAFIAVPLFLVLKQPDLSTTIVITIVFAIMFFIAGLSRRLIVIVMAIGVPLFFLFMALVMNPDIHILEEYQQRRILAWRYPDEYYSTEAMQQQNSIMAIASGQVSGKGLNNDDPASLKNGNYVPEPQTDFIFSVVGEELGFVGCVTVVLLIFLITMNCVMIGSRHTRDEGKLICIGVGSLIGFQSIINISVSTGLIPNTGVTLPFVSYGATSLVSLFMGIGLVMNVGMNTDAFDIPVLDLDEEKEYESNVPE